MRFNIGDIVTTQEYVQLIGGYCKVIGLDYLTGSINIKVIFVSKPKYNMHTNKTYWLSESRFIKVENMVE